MRHLVFYVMGTALCLAAENDTKFLPPANLIDSKVAATHVLDATLAPGGVLGKLQGQKGNIPADVGAPAF